MGIPMASQSTPGSLHNVSHACTSAWAMAKERSPFTETSIASGGTFRKLATALQP